MSLLIDIRGQWGAIPAQQGCMANIRLMFQLIVTKFHSPLTFSSPRNRH